MNKRYNDLNSYFRSIFGCRVQKITIDAGLSCPNRDGKISTGGCIYCNTRGSGTGAHAKGHTVTDQILAGKKALLKRQLKEIEKFKDLEKMKIPQDFDFTIVHGLSNELKEKLSTVSPSSLGQASRIDGITPAAISVLMIAIKAYRKN